MNKKKLASALLGTAMMGGLLLQAAPASAAVASGTTGGSVGFSGHIPPTNPSGGDLDLVWVPRAFEFGNSNANTTAAKTYAATNGATKYVVVRDQRNANGTTGTPKNEWKVTAKASTLTDSGSTLTGAKYTFTGNQLKNYNSASGADTEAPESSGAINTTLPVGHTAAVETNISLEATGLVSVDVMHADDAAVDGKYAAELNGISLVIPANTSQEGKQYTGTIEWSLDDTI
ncbi:WxL domain-containing protein [Enterococcus hulanensis]|uniref:WxL domain-containing protein n=1 Tax=Enterococcus hulanensis TaxID=2559929 RepID=A0ABU3EV19_9ENTE|nr:WxL domain-containing protein [Enterococcus hulanensis]MDT2598704.1 WxL domain-containing protein [Enterococcus hulanensis]MDT2607792.1 WxL domain-containing protein [Enterococcus hulanensis]MDT2615087.1 WxL domain-containing protein [Enterococcus hulanensis]MDT2626943.1 WxL domain-containing protein [Enterococcus hulanensis]MDT2654158.1 WxL domain-containing protein [Enterococcus hulanensis]